MALVDARVLPDTDDRMLGSGLICMDCDRPPRLGPLGLRATARLPPAKQSVAIR